MHPVEVNFVDAGISVGDGLRQVGSGSGDAQYPASGSLEAARARSGSGVEHLGGGIVQLNRVAGADLARIAVSRNDHADRWVTLPFEAGACQLAGGGTGQR